ncbi:hypothetical protein [Phocaeicola salanitronis]|nr:hypothetical protein [Phocaeicola salanitronis]MDM8305129.1 hypothetical protein [Phocaeicola salanitronis]
MRSCIGFIFRLLERTFRQPERIFQRAECIFHGLEYKKESLVNRNASC